VSEEPGGAGEQRAPGEPVGGGNGRLDPDRAAAAARRRPARTPPPVIDTRRYQRLIGLLGLGLVIVVSVSFLTTHSAGTAGIPAGRPLRLFAAPLARSTLNGAVNLAPPCTLARHDPRALNICLLVRQAPLVLGFFVTNSGACERQVDTMQAVSRQFSPGQVQFAAVAVHASHPDAARVVRAHHWTIPIGYDVDGRLGAAYGVEICPLLELADRGGLVARRLIGEHWSTTAALARQVRLLLARGTGGR
jgi:hypothetical protein